VRTLHYIAFSIFNYIQYMYICIYAYMCTMFHTDALPQQPQTHEAVNALHLFVAMKHFVSEQLLIRGMHSLLDVVPNAWDWASHLDVHNINEGVDSRFDEILQNMNANTNYKYNVSWNHNKIVFVWIMRQLHFIAKHGIVKFTQLYSNFNVPPQLDGLWQLKTDLVMDHL
jgi:hypothetical protein